MNASRGVQKISVVEWESNDFGAAPCPAVSHFRSCRPTVAKLTNNKNPLVMILYEDSGNCDDE